MAGTWVFPLPSCWFSNERRSTKTARQTAPGLAREVVGITN
ncbi:hypothetical protein HMPREF9622_00166 [Cutibacterium modestum HL037PA3]|nr:hypothetical protein HMPREF9622_00166 [Cutibacterium modestum HL037PA3]